MMYRIVTSAICLIILSLEIVPICLATNGSAIVFESKDMVAGDLGQIGVAIQLEDGTWIAGAIEDPEDLGGKLIGTSGFSGGWYRVFETEEAVIRDFKASRSSESDTELGDILPHAAYDKMKMIPVQKIIGEQASGHMLNFGDRGYSVWMNNDRFIYAYDGLDAYSVKELEDKGWMKSLKDFFDRLPGESKTLPSDSGTGAAASDALDQSHPNGVPASVTLTLYVHDGSADGSVISDANVKGHDGSGNNFQQTTDSNGYVTIKGDPGTWSFSASASGYEINNWDQEILENGTKHAFLHEGQQQESPESSVVGKWRFISLNCQCSPEEITYGCSCDPYEVTFNEDGTFIDDDGSTGRWVQYGDTIRYLGDQFVKGEMCSCNMEGTIESDTMIIDKNYCPCDMYTPQNVMDMTGLSSRESKRTEMGIRLVGI